MKHFSKFRSLLLAAVLCVAGAAFAAPKHAQEEDLVPILTFKTSIYDQYQEANNFSIVLGVTDTTYLYVDCGNGASEYEVGRATMDSASVSGTLIYCSVTEAGTVTIYGTEADALLVDYLNADGCYITDINLGKLVNLDVLSLCHNSLTSLDLSRNTKIRALYLSDNAFAAATPLEIGEKPDLMILELQIVENLSPKFDLAKYPKLMSFDAYHCPSLGDVNPTNCPNLLQLTLEMTNVKTLDLSKNPNLIILNVSETGVTELDLSHNTKLQQLYCEHVSSVFNTDAKIKNLDVSHCPDIYRLIANGNALTELDVTNLQYLISLSCMDNYITSLGLDVTKNKQLSQVKIDRNCLDFATLPFDPGTWEEYTYAQRNLPVERSYKEGDVLDFSSRVLREGTTTEAALYAFDVTTPDTWVKLDTTYYSYKEGRVTLKKAYTDSLFIAFANSKFLENNLYTEHFKVKIASDYGKPSQVMSFTPTIQQVNLTLAMQGASAENPQTFYVSYNGDDDTLYPFTTTASTLSEATPVVLNTPWAYSTVKVYIPENAAIVGVGLAGQGVSSIDVSPLISLQELNLSNTGLYSIDLSRNRWLSTLDLSHNQLYICSLAGVNDLFAKNVLGDINLSYNNLQTVTLNPQLAIRNLDLSHNQIESISLADADSIHSVDLSGNQLSSLTLTHCTALRSLNVSDNQLTELTLPTENNITHLALENNQFTLANIPAHGNIPEANYTYAPQADIIIATKGPCTDLATQNLTLDGNKTAFRWLKEDGTALVEGTDYTLSNGFTRFLNTELGKVYCEITNAAYPAFVGNKALKTTFIEVAGMPTNEIASFNTTQEGDSVELSLAANQEGVALYIDWEGNDNVIQYVLGTSYRLFTATTHKDKLVHVYTYTPDEKITVFSMTGATLADFDGSKLNDAGTLTIQNAGLSQIALPTNRETLKDLNLSENNFTDIDFASYPNLQMLAVGYNQLKTLDLSKNQKLQVVNAGGNSINKVVFDNPNLWYLDLNANQIANIDFTKAANIEQLALNHNQLCTIDISPLTHLMALVLNNNYFNFQTLPAVKPSYVLYAYYNQAPFEAALQEGNTIDLGSQAMVGDSVTTYTWYLGVPEWDSDQGAYVGEELVEGDEYTVQNGVTTFLKSFEGVMCIMTNPAFPSLYLYTNLYDVVGTSVEQVHENGLHVYVRGNDVIVATDKGQSVALYSVSGALVANTLSQVGETILPNITTGAYIVRVGDKAQAVLVP